MAETANKILAHAVLLVEGVGINSRLAPLQLGVGMPGGAEIIAKIVGARPADHLLYELDISNAYGSISRSKIAEQLSNHAVG